MARKKYSCDFETTTKLDDCRVWAYAYMEIGNKKNYKIGNNLFDFMTWAKKEQADLYFHNARFDGEFIVNYLLLNGWEHNKTGDPGTFSTTISSMGQWYVIDICYGYKIGKTGKRKKLHTVIYDSLKKLPFTVKSIAEGFKLPIKKGDIDYHLERPIGWEITPEEYSYIKNDVEIIADALDAQFKEGLKKMTNGSDSLGGFKDTISKDQFDNLFPVFSHELDEQLRPAYRGGFTWLKRAYEGRKVGSGIVFDVNSLYPSVMYDKELPWGFPIHFDGEYVEDKTYPLYIQVIECEFHIKPDKIPTIQIKKQPLLFKGNEYLEHSGGERVRLYVTNIDLELIREHYELWEPEFIEGWKFRSRKGVFNNFIDKWSYIKNTETGAKKILAKLMLNSLYGKFASNPDVTGKEPYLKDDGSTGFDLPRDKETGKVIKEYKDPIYTPMGIFITSWARHVTITAAQKCYDRIIYCDTDSIHLTGTEVPEAIKDIVHPKKLGYWKHEGTFTRAKFIRQKTYLEQYPFDLGDYNKFKEEKDDLHKRQLGYLRFTKKWKNKNMKLKCPRPDIKCAGMPEKIKDYVTHKSFAVGFSCNGKLTPKHVRGGVVLIDSKFTIK